MRRIYLIRHAEADTGFGRDHVCLGRMDVPLSHEGEKQALRLAQFFKGTEPAGIWTSPLKRCVDTSRILAERSGHAGMPVKVVEDLTEIDTGEWDLLPFSEIRERYPDAYEERGRHMGTFVIPGGESFLAAGNRFAAAFVRLFRESEGDILVTAHAGVIRAFLCLLTGKDMDCVRDYHVPYASMTVLAVHEKDGGTICGGTDLREWREQIEIEAVGLRPVEAICLSEVDRIWAQCKVTQQQRRHMEAVADLAMNLIGYDMALVRADLLDHNWPCGGGRINVRAVYYAALLHDIRRSDGGRAHAANGAAYLEKEGYHQLARIVRSHHDPAVYQPGEPLCEAEIVYYADKLIMEERMVSLEERFAQSRKKCASEEALANHEKQYAAARGIEKKILS